VTAIRGQNRISTAVPIALRQAALVDARMGHMNATTLTAVGISGSPSARSKSRTLLEHALSALRTRGVETILIDLSALPADALLGRRRTAEVDDALATVARANIVVASTPVYRATYSGLLKVFFDLLPVNALAEKTAIAIATGGSPAHQLVIDHGLRPLFSSVCAITTPTGIYGTDSAFENGVPHATLIARIAEAAGEAVTLSGRTYSAAAVPTSTLVES
jgi:FMN reductase